MRTNAVPRRATRIPRVGPGPRAERHRGRGRLRGRCTRQTLDSSCSASGAAGASAKLSAPDRSRMTEPIRCARPPPPELPAAHAQPQAHRPRGRAVDRWACCIAAIVIAGFLIHLPYVIISPGSATPLDSSGRADRGRADLPRDAGNVRFLTVRVSTREPNVWRVVTSWLDPDRDGREAQHGAGLSHRRAEPARSTRS